MPRFLERLAERLMSVWTSQPAGSARAGSERSDEPGQGSPGPAGF